MSQPIAALLQEALRVKQERDLVVLRLERLKTHQGEVSPPVYEKVLGEYTVRLKEIEGRWAEAMRPLDAERERLQQERGRLSEAIASSQEAREELALRHKIAELDDEPFRGQMASIEAHHQRLKRELSDIDSTLAQLDTGFSSSHPETSGDDFHVPMAAEDATDPHLDGMPAPPPSGPATAEAVLALYDEGKMLEKWPLAQATRIGRAPGNQIVLKEPKVSRHHATVEQQDGHYVIRDMGSSNGTFVNGNKISEAILSAGDEIVIGDFRLVLEISP